MKAVVTGAAGFIGSNLVDRLLKEGHEVRGIDNFSTGNREFLESAQKSKHFSLVERDLLDPKALDGVIDKSVDFVFHLAANADVKDGILAPRRDLEQNIIVTWNVLEAMRKSGVKKIAFSSTGSVYGEAPVIPTPETCPFPIQTSMYGAAKLAGEAYLSSYAEAYGFESYIFRFVSILGPRYTHGHVYDFVKKLKNDPTRMEVLGDGKQKKSYLHISDCVEAILKATQQGGKRNRAGGLVQIYNLGTDEYCNVDFSIGIICKRLGVKPKLEYTGGDRGWVGDNPFIFLECSKIKSIGWKAKFTIEQGIESTLDYLLANEWVLSRETKRA